MGNVKSSRNRHLEDGAWDLFSPGLLGKVANSNDAKEDLHFKESQVPLNRRDNVNTAECTIFSNSSVSSVSKGLSSNNSSVRDLMVDFRGSLKSISSFKQYPRPVSKSFSSIFGHSDDIHGGESSLRKRDSLPTLKRTTSNSAHSYRLIQKEVINQTLQEKLTVLRKTFSNNSNELDSKSEQASKVAATESQNKSSRMTKERRNRRRAEHNQAIIDDLCDIVTDLFTSEKSLFVEEVDRLDIESSPNQQIRQFLSDLPIRYALRVESPSEVLVHMRLMTAARSDDNHAAVHIVKLDSPSVPYKCYSSGRDLKLVTISCSDRHGLLEYITGKLLATGGSRVLDADCITTSDNIALDRFVVEMKGRLRLDKLKQYIEQYLKGSKAMKDDTMNAAPCSSCVRSTNTASIVDPPVHNQLYHQHQIRNISKRESMHQEMQSAVPLSEAVATANATVGNLSINNNSIFPTGFSDQRQPGLERVHSAPVESTSKPCQSPGESSQCSVHARRPLINRDATAFSLDEKDCMDNNSDCLESTSQLGLLDSLLQEEEKKLPYIPPDDIMLTEKLFSGRISNVYRAIWKKPGSDQSGISLEEVALKVSLLDDPSSIDDNIAEFCREADIAASLNHFNICKIIGVAKDSECFCIAYEYCSGGSLKNLLSDTSRCYEYLPIALDIANGMAYLHSRNVIHRDLKPANILLTANNRAKIADFGMSVANTGQELTAETGTYRWMAPEVIRHESYSSNADVYSFGVVLWQLITREVPFPTLTPIQTAYAVAEGSRPDIPSSTPEQLRDIILACWDEDSERRPSFTYIVMALADYAKMAFSPANVGAQTVKIADEMLANVSGNSTVNVDFSVLMISPRRQSSSNNIDQKSPVASKQQLFLNQGSGSYYSNSIGLPI